MPTVISGGTLPRALDPTLRALINLRCEQLRRNYDGPLDEIVSFLIVEPGDTEEAIVEALGFSPLVNLSDGTRFGDPEFTPNWEWATCHGAFWELVYILTQDGFGTIVFVPNDPGVEFDLHALCLEHGHD